MYCSYYITCIIKHKDQNLKGTKLKQILMKLLPQPVAHVPNTESHDL